MLDNEKKFWTTRDGRKILISDMTTEHLYNSINYLEQLKNNLENLEDNIISLMSLPSSNMTNYYYNKSLNNISSILCNCHAFINRLKTELNKRKRIN